MTDLEHELLLTCQAVLADLQQLIDAAIIDCGGGAVGETFARVQYGPLFDRRDQLQAVIAKALSRNS